MSIHKVVNGEMKEIASNTRWDATTKTLSIDGIKCFSASELVQDANCFLALDAHPIQFASDTSILTIDHDGRLFGSAKPQTNDSSIYAVMWFRKTSNDAWSPLFIANQTMQIDLVVKTGFQFFFANQPNGSNNIDTAVAFLPKHTLALYYTPIKL